MGTLMKHFSVASHLIPKKWKRPKVCVDHIAFKSIGLFCFHCNSTAHLEDKDLSKYETDLETRLILFIGLSALKIKYIKLYFIGCSQLLLLPLPSQNCFITYVNIMG